MIEGGVASLLELTQGTVRLFLQTVVIMDDEATYEENNDKRNVESRLTAPGRVGASASEEDMLETPSTPTNMKGLNAKIIVDAFADQGLVCAVLKPILGEDASVQVLRINHAAQRADILVLDWEVNGTKGTVACEIIKALVTDANKDRLRLIAIYTAESGLAAIITAIRDALQLSESRGLDDQYTINYGFCRIVAYAKEGVGAGERDIPEGSLPNKLLIDFASMTNGLLSNVALLSLAAIRENTHRMLAKFKPELDAPFLTHRALNTQPNDADGHLIPLVVSEFQAVLEDSGVSNFINNEAIESWIHLVLPQETEQATVQDTENERPTREQLLSMLLKGVKCCGIQSDTMLGKIVARINENDQAALDCITAILCNGDGEKGKQCDKELAYLMMVRSRYSVPPPRLSLGTIVAEDNGQNTKYKFCVLPRCDSAHLTKKRKFPFLKITKRCERGPFDLVVCDKGAFQLLNISLRAYESEMIELIPNKSGVVVATKIGEDWVFQSGERRLRWIADLKPDHAQRVANDYAAQISRVGLTESEWQRRWTKKGS